jgi:hypothetical protein
MYILGYRIKFFVAVNSSFHKPENLKDLELYYVLHILKVTTSKFTLRNLLLEIVQNLTKEWISVIEVIPRPFPSTVH